MNPMYFGASERPLFGVYQAPTAQPGRNRGVVLCSPFGDEGIMSHRAFRALAERLVAERFHVFRFDYFGTGDSGGEGHEASIEQWLEDIEAAADEIKDVAGVAKLSLVGLRLGATLALTAAAGKRGDLDRIVLWDPIVRGEPYLNRIAQAHNDYIKWELGQPSGFQSPNPATLDEIMGFPLSKDFKGAMNAIDLISLTFRRPRNVNLILSEPLKEYDDLANHLQSQKATVEQKRIQVRMNWNSDEAVTSSLVPTEAISAIVESLA
jgi:pimeloyl-ACP methyl ester carboxylesterase